MRWFVAIVGVAACGRLGFDAAPGAGDDARGGASNDAGQGAPAMVQVKSTYSMNSPSADLPITATRPNDLIIVLTADIYDQSPLMSIGDSAGDTFVSAKVNFIEGSSSGEVWYVASGVGGATSLTITDGSLHDRDVWLLEFSGVHELDTTNEISNQSYVATVSAPSVAPTRVPAVVISIVQLSTAVQTVSAPFSAVPPVQGDGAAFAIVDAAGSYGPTFTVNMPGTSGAATVAFE